MSNAFVADIIIGIWTLALAAFVAYGIYVTFKPKPVRRYNGWVIPQSIYEWVRYNGGDPNDVQQVREQAHRHGDCPGSPVCPWCWNERV